MEKRQSQEIQNKTDIFCARYSGLKYFLFVSKGNIGLTKHIGFLVYFVLLDSAFSLSYGSVCCVVLVLSISSFSTDPDLCHRSANSHWFLVFCCPLFSLQTFFLLGIPIWLDLGFVSRCFEHKLLTHLHMNVKDMSPYAIGGGGGLLPYIS